MCVLRSRRTRRQKDYDSDPDYEGERSERSGGRPSRARPAAKRSTAASHHHHHPSSGRAPQPGAHQQALYSSQQAHAQRFQVLFGGVCCLDAGQ